MAGYSINISDDVTDGFDDVIEIYENLVRALRDVGDGTLSVGTLVLTDDAGKTSFVEAKDVEDVTDSLDISDAPDTDETLNPVDVDTDTVP